MNGQGWVIDQHYSEKVKGKVVGDIGSGSGFYSRRFAKAGARKVFAATLF